MGRGGREGGRGKDEGGKVKGGLWVIRTRCFIKSVNIVHRKKKHMRTEKDQKVQWLESESS